MKPLIKTSISDGKNKGYCWNCQNYFKKNDVVITFEQLKVDRIRIVKICALCYMEQLAVKFGWANLSALIQSKTEKSI